MSIVSSPGRRATGVQRSDAGFTPMSQRPMQIRHYQPKEQRCVGAYLRTPGLPADTTTGVGRRGPGGDQQPRSIQRRVIDVQAVRDRRHRRVRHRHRAALGSPRESTPRSPRSPESADEPKLEAVTHTGADRVRTEERAGLKLVRIGPTVGGGLAPGYQDSRVEDLPRHPISCAGPVRARNGLRRTAAERFVPFLKTCRDRTSTRGSSGARRSSRTRRSGRLFTPPIRIR